MRPVLLSSVSMLLLACSLAGDSQEVDLSRIKLPPGFEISVYSDDVPGARSLALSESGTLFVSTRRGDGDVFAVVDTDGDGRADMTYTIASGLNTPNGVALRSGALYVAEISRILRYDDIENRLDDPPEPVVVYDELPTEGHHGWKYIAFGPDDKLYVPIGAPCNICDPGEPYASIWRMDPDGSNMESFATGIRNTVGFTWHPETGEMWFTDNGRDMMGDDLPPDELNHAPEKGMHFGYPYFHGGDIPDPEFGQGRNAGDYVAPARRLGPHVASLGIEIYDGVMFPAEYRHQVFIAEHGSWNRSDKIGYRVSLVRLDENFVATGYETFAEGWLQGQEAWGRPVDLEQLPDGSLLISDDHAGAVYRVVYSGS